MRLLRRLISLENPPATAAAAALAKQACLLCGQPATRRTAAGGPLCDACEVPPWACFHSGWFVGSTWDFRVDASQLAPGEYIAADICIDDPTAPLTLPGPIVTQDTVDAEDLIGHRDPKQKPRTVPKDRSACHYAIRERITRDPQDLGWVYAPGNQVAGRVVAIDGDRIDWRFAAGWSWERCGYEQLQPLTPEEIAARTAALGPDPDDDL
jgi:hypothetical protein